MPSTRNASVAHADAGRTCALEAFVAKDVSAEKHRGFFGHGSASGLRSAGGQAGSDLRRGRVAARVIRSTRPSTGRGIRIKNRRSDETWSPADVSSNGLPSARGAAIFLTTDSHPRLWSAPASRIFLGSVFLYAAGTALLCFMVGADAAARRHARA